MTYSYVNLVAFAMLTAVTQLCALPRFAPLNQGRMQRTASLESDTCGWGQLIILEGDKAIQYKDVIIWVGATNSQAKKWDWTLSNTRHNPGIQIADIQQFIDQVDEVILTRGVDLILQVPQTTIDWVRSKGKVCHVGETPQMIELYNRLVDQGKKVGGLFHSTC